MKDQSVKIRVEPGPAHVRVTFFLGPEGETRANCGTLTLTKEGWARLLPLFMSDRNILFEASPVTLGDLLGVKKT